MKGSTQKIVRGQEKRAPGIFLMPFPNGERRNGDDSAGRCLPFGMEYPEKEMGESMNERIIQHIKTDY